MITDLETPERGFALENRQEPDRSPRKRQEKARPEAQETEALRAELADLRGRLEAARTLEPKQVHRVHNCRTCFRQARDATIRAIEGT
jgi:hypothetical protein